MSEKYRHIDPDKIASNHNQELYDFIDPIFAEQIHVSLRVLSEASTLPQRLVEYHRRLLEYWGVYDTDTI